MKHGSVTEIIAFLRRKNCAQLTLHFFRLLAIALIFCIFPSATAETQREVLYFYENYCEATFNMDGTVVSAQRIKYEPGIGEFNIQMDDTGIFIESMDHCMEIQMPEWTFDYQLTKWHTEFGLTTDSNGNPVSYFIEPEDISYTEDDSLYYLGKAKLLSSMEATTYGENKDFCCWFDEAGTGVLMRYTHNPEGKIEPEVVTIWSMGYYNEIDDAIDAAINQAIGECNEKGIKGKETTPFLLARVSELTGGDSLASNIQLVFNNAKVAAQTAVAYYKN